MASERGDLKSAAGVPEMHGIVAAARAGEELAIWGKGHVRAVFGVIVLIVSSNEAVKRQLLSRYIRSMFFPITSFGTRSTMNPNQIPTAAMREYFERRTHEHIARVRRCLALLANFTDHGEELIARAQVHDASKFGPQELVPYVWLTEYHRCRRSGEPFEYPDGVAEEVKRAIHRHVTTNRHHPECHADPNDMSEVDLIEMVCDWTAMAQEFGEVGGSARGWADKTIGKRVAFNDEKRRFIYQLIEELERQFEKRPLCPSNELQGADTNRLENTNPH